MTPTTRARRGQANARACAPYPAALPKGFTLIELVIALALVALITVLLFSGLRLGSRAWDGVDRVAERNAELRSARGFLDLALSQARDLVLRFEEADRQVFAGNAASLEFVAPLSEHVGIPGLYVLRLGIEGRGEDSRLVMTRWLLHPDVLAGNVDTPEWRPLDPDSPGISGNPAREQDLAAGAFGQTVLLEGVGEFQLSYFGIATETDLDKAAAGHGTPTPAKPPRFGQGKGVGEEPEGQWYEEWVRQPHPPRLIRVHLTSRRQDWPDSIIRLPQVEQAQGGQIQVGVPQVLPNPAAPVPTTPAGAKSSQGVGK